MASNPIRTPSGEIEADVIAAALDILDEIGPEGFTVRAIASRAGVAPMAIYNHFDGKNGVIEAIWSDGFEQLRLCLGVSAADPHEDLLASGLAYRSFALEHRAHYTVMFMHRFVGFEPTAAASQVAALAFQELVNHVERCQDVGLLQGYGATDVAQMLWSACHGYVSLEILDINFATEPDATFVGLLRALQRGLES